MLQSEVDLRGGGGGGIRPTTHCRPKGSHSLHYVETSILADRPYNFLKAPIYSNFEGYRQRHCRQRLRGVSTATYFHHLDSIISRLTEPPALIYRLRDLY